MIKYIRKIIWNIASKTADFRGKERIIALISRPSSLNQITIKRQGVTWYMQGHDLNEFHVAIKKITLHYFQAV